VAEKIISEKEQWKGDSILRVMCARKYSGIDGPTVTTSYGSTARLSGEGPAPPCGWRVKSLRILGGWTEPTCATPPIGGRSWVYLRLRLRRQIGGGTTIVKDANVVAGLWPVPGILCRIGLPVSGRPVTATHLLDVAILESPLLPQPPPLRLIQCLHYWPVSIM